MIKEPIKVYEHETLKVNGVSFTSEHLMLLAKFLGDGSGDDFPYYSLINNGVKFKQYVGVISVGDIQIEVLPKADKKAGEDDKATWEHHLLEMLQVVYKMKVNLSSKADQQMKRSPVLDVFLNHFMDEVELIMHIGLVKAYRRVEDNRTSLKGRLVLSKHIIKNMVHQERFYVNYTTYDRNHVFNRLLCKALRIIPDISSNSYTTNRAKTLLFELPELDDIVATEALFDRLTFDRKTEDYRNAMELARMILLNYMPNMSYRKDNSVIALMFDMNKLWEEYVCIMLRRQLPDCTVLAQSTKRFWYSATVGGKTVRPDIVIMKDKSCIAVLDTKWKCPPDGKPSDSDLKQMYVYHKYWDTDRTALLYPASSDRGNVVGHFVSETGDTAAECDMFYLPIKPERGPQLLEIGTLIDFIIKKD